MKKKILFWSAFAFIALTIICTLILLNMPKEKPYQPETIVEGDNLFQLGSYSLAQDGLKVFKDIISKSENMTENYTVSFFEAKIDKKGKVISFTLSLDTFDENKEYCGLAGYSYADEKLTYQSPAVSKTLIVYTYNVNSSLNYLDEELKKIPLKKQLKVSGLSSYKIRYAPFTLIESGTPIFDGRDGDTFPVLKKKDYNAGQGGISDGNTNVVFRLYDGASVATGQQYLYVCKPLDAATAIGNQQYNMECDYYINNGTLKFSRNYGADWINTDITEEDLNTTLEFYRNGFSLPPQSIFLSADESLPIAFFYGGNPVLAISSDNGEVWSHIDIFPKASDYGRSITKRAVGFVTSEFGYAALGTDWSMGAGENKMCYFTFDGGQTWTEKPLPLAGMNRTLNDIAMANEKAGAVALDGGADVYFPLLYVTEDTGDNWTEIELPFDQLPREIQYLSDIESLIFADGVYTLTLGQGDWGTVKATFTTTDLTGTWQYTGYKNSSVHTVG